MAKKDLSQQMTEFMKNYRAAQDQAKSFEGMHNQLSNLLQNNLESNTNNDSGNAGTQAAQPAIGTATTSLMDKIKGLNQKIKDNANANNNNQQESGATTLGKKLKGYTQAIKDYSQDKKNGTGQTTYDADDVVEYTYKPGDTFGQVILDLGLNTDNGLWGDNGDVNYYTQQLVDQGIWEDNQPHNIPIGTKIKLYRRGAERELTAEEKLYNTLKALGITRKKSN